MVLILKVLLDGSFNGAANMQGELNGLRAYI